MMAARRKSSTMTSPRLMPRLLGWLSIAGEYFLAVTRYSPVCNTLLTVNKKWLSPRTSGITSFINIFFNRPHRRDRMGKTVLRSCQGRKKIIFYE